MADIRGYARRCLAGDSGGRVGIEAEFLVYDRDDPALYVPITRTRAALPDLPGGSRITFEPGGQLELSGPPAHLPLAVARFSNDLDLVRLSLRAAGLILGERALDLCRPPRRQLRMPRYNAMAAFLGEPYGPMMMCSTSSIQVNVDGGPGRWERAHRFGPVLLAAFANSPWNGWASGRQAVWAGLDPSRTRSVDQGGDPAEDWARYLADARLMVVKDGWRPVLDGSIFRDFSALVGREPDEDDLAYHATTLFPPVRPRGWLEIRYLDAQDPDLWPVCVAVPYALIVDDLAAKAAGEALTEAAFPGAEPYGTGVWEEAARLGLAAPGLRAAAVACFDAAIEALPRLGASPALVGQVAAYAGRLGDKPKVDLQWT
ncbi:ergothioneine biosynthesis glutamate--cysteine ligase EgtA [Streptosporangiaceae bacterium NEAU-GS5]|nr:ergothioneine biosynthesis glutamate--cysteine ligase EgtA [Streptosporangiaceae bacterium NEAU-GS5]